MATGTERAWAALATLALLGAGCTSGCEGEVEVPVDAIKGPLVEAREVRFVMPASRDYGIDRSLTPFDRRIKEALPPSSRLQVDPCLALAATEFVRHVAPGDDGELTLPKELQPAALHRAGCTDGWAASHLFFSSQDDEGDFMAHLAEVLAQKTGQATHVGVGRARSGSPYRWGYAIFLAERGAIFKPIARGLSPGARLKIEGRLIDGLKEPRVLLLEPGGEVVELDIEEAEGGFAASAQVGRVIGEHWVELLATGPLGPQVMALFPVYVGVDPPDSVRLEPPPDESMVKTERDAEALMHTLLNADRRRFGLQPLAWSAPLADIARGHSRDMSQNKFFAHISPRRGALEDRFAAARFPARSMGENISRNTSVYDAEQGLMLSLGHRENILAAHYTHVGVGVVFEVDEYGRRNMILTQNFAAPQRKVSGRQFQNQLLKTMKRKREAMNLPDLRLDDDLQQIAALHSRLVDPSQGGQPTSKISEMIKLSLKERRYDYRSFYLQTHTVLDPDDVKLPEVISKSRVTRVGIGAFPMEQPSGSTLWKTLIILTEH